MRNLIWGFFLFILFLVNWRRFEENGSPFNLLACAIGGIATFVQILAYGGLI